MKIKVAELEKLIQKILKKEYYSSKQTKEIAEVLIYAEITDKNTQGIVKLLGPDAIQKLIPSYKAKVIKSTPLSSFIDGGHNSGILVSRMATKLAIKKCKKNGLAIVGTNNTYPSTGAIGFYANEIAKNDLIGIVMSGSPKCVAPFGSIEPLLGTNPIAFSFPTETQPLIFDMATSAITFYGLVRAKLLGEKLPEGIAIDKNGDLTTDPEKAIKGAILPFINTHKGSGVSMMIDLFTGSLVGAVNPEKNGQWYCGNLFLAIDPDLLIGKENLKKNVTVLINKIKLSKDGNTTNKIMIPGEKGLKKMIQARNTGEIEINDHLFESMMVMVNNVK